MKERNTHNIPQIHSLRDIPVPTDLRDNWSTKWSNVFITKAMFYETSLDKKYAIYTFSDEDFEQEGKVYYSIKKRYMEEQDVTEYRFATRWFHSWEHWQRIVSSPEVREYIDKLREELEVQMRSYGLRSLVESAKSGNYNAAKFLVDKGWSPKRGRPSKEEVQGERKQQARLQKDIEEDMKRLNLSVISKNKKG